MGKRSRSRLLAGVLAGVLTAGGALTGCGSEPMQSATPAPVATNLDDPAAYAADIVLATNEARTAEGVAVLDVADCAAQAAEERARALVGVAELTHAPLDGTMRDCGVEQAAENLSRASAPAGDVVEAWLGSSGHRNNLLDPSLLRVGVACVPDNGALLCSQVFLGR